MGTDERVNTDIEDVLEDDVKKELETDQGSVFSKKEVMNRLRKQFTRWSGDRNKRLLGDYQEGEIDRRKFLRMLGLGLGGAVVSSSGGYFLGKQVFDKYGDTVTGYQSAASAVPSRFNFSNTVNIVEQFSADNSGGQAIDSQLKEAISSNTLIVFPEGRYKLDSKTIIRQNNVGLIGEGETIFQMPKGKHRQTSSGPPGKSIINAVGDNFLFKGINWNQGGDWKNPSEKHGSPGMRFAGKDWHMEDVEFVGRGMVKGYATPIMVTIGPKGENLMKNVVCVTGSDWSRYWSDAGPMDRIGVYVGVGGGTVRMESLHLEEFGNNALYCSRTGAGVHVAGGIFRNNNVNGIRIAGSNSWAEGAYIAVDPDKYTGPTTFPRKPKGWSMRGFWIEDRKKRSPNGPTEIRNCDILIKDHEKANSAVRIAHGYSINMTKTRIRYERNGLPAIAGNASASTITDSHFTGSSSDGAVINVPGSVKNTRICMPNRSTPYVQGASTSGLKTDGCEDVRDAPAGPSGSSSLSGSSDSSGSDARC